MASVLFGAKRATLEEVTRVAFGQATVELDVVQLAKLPKTSKQPLVDKVTLSKTVVGAAAHAAAEAAVQSTTSGGSHRQSLSASTAVRGDLTNQLARPQVRAVMLVRAVGLLFGRANVRVQVIEYLAACLNAGVLPALPSGPSDKIVLERLAQFVLGQGALLSDDETEETVASALEKHGLSAPGLTAFELESFTQGVAASAALLGLVAQGTRTLMDLGEAVASYTCEAMQAHPEPYQASNTDVCRPHKGAIRVASNLRSQQEGSSQIGARTGVKVMDGDALRCVAHYLGSVRETADRLAQQARTEINSSEAGPATKSAKAAGEFHAQPIWSLLIDALHVMNVLASSGAGRLAEMLSKDTIKEHSYDVPSGLWDEFSAPWAAAEEAATKVGNVLQTVSAASSLAMNQDSPDLFLHVLAACVAVGRTEQIVGVELAVAASILNAREEKYLAQAREKQAKKEAAAKARAEAQAQAGTSQGGGKKKDKKDKKEKSLPESLVLGNGTKLFRKRVLSGFRDMAQGGAEELARALGSSLDAFDVDLAEWLSGTLLAAANQVRKPKIPKGTRDYMPAQMAIRQKAFKTITDVFKRHGAVTIETPVFELKETLTGKYGDEAKLIYDLSDQGGEALSLRYDLTVPFARFVAMHGIGSIKRYHISRVYRRDNPAINRGRYREFFQCDLDIAGSYALMIPDSEVLKIVTEILDELQIGQYAVKLNHRKLLDGIMEVSGVPAERFRGTCSCIDKLDKEPWEDVETKTVDDKGVERVRVKRGVKREMIEEKGIPEEVATKIGEFVVMKGSPWELHKKLVESKLFEGNESGTTALAELKVLFEYLDAYGVLDRFSFDLSLARGLDYYTGVIYEAVFTEADLTGSIAGGGRYDNLVGMFNTSGRQVPAVGVSIGIERVFAILESKTKMDDVRATETQVLVSSVGKGLTTARMELAALLWGAGIKAEIMYTANPKMQESIEFCLSQGVPYMVLVGEDELKNGTVNLKTMATKEQEVVKRDELVGILEGRL